MLLLVYSVDNRNSFNNVRLKWIPEIKLHCPKVPVVLVGMYYSNELSTPHTIVASHFVSQELKSISVKMARIMRKIV